MAFRTDGLGKAYTKAQNEAIRVKAFATQARNALIAGTVSANAVMQIMTNMKSSIEVWDSVSSLAGIGAYADNEENDPAYDVAAEFTSMRAEAVTVRDWVITNFPASGGFIQKDTLEVDGAITVRQFTPAQTTGLQTALADLIAAIA
jgi:hypothetical protein